MNKDKAYVEANVKEGICPRCGREIVGYPALSRYANVSICSDCGTDEALSGFIGMENDFNNWEV